MYCQKCNRLLEDNNLICPQCGYDNSKNTKKRLTETIDKPKKRPTLFFFIIFFLCLLVVFLIIVLIKYENKNKLNNNIEETTTISTNETYKNDFTYKDIKLRYPDTWGSSTGTVFYKEYAKINITFRNITETEYNELLDVNDCLDYNFSTFKAKTYASDNAYAYTFKINETYYLVTVNYTKDASIFTAKVQNEISEILTTITA